MDSLSYNISFVTNATGVLPKIETGLDAINSSTQKVTKSFGDCYKSLLSVELVANNLNQVKQSFDQLIAPGIALNSQMTELSAITNVTGSGLKEIEKAARASAKAFGTDASSNVNSYKLILSQLSPEIAKNSTAMKMMGDNVNVLSKSMGGDTVAATNVLTTAMNQYGVNLDDPIAASKIMADMMNVMAAGAQAGSAELPQIQSALEQVGMVAKTAGVSFVETNAAIQLLDKAGKKGSEGGVALRNVMTTLSEGRFLPKDTQAELKAAGIDIVRLGNKTLPLTDRLKMLRPIMNDNALVTKVFGKENAAAAIAMVQGIDAMSTLKTQITGTNSAVTQANIVMGSYEERSKRTQAKLEDLKIGFFNITQSIAPYVQNTLAAVSTLGELASTSNSLYSIYESQLIPKIWGAIKGLFVKAVVTQADTVATAENATVTGVGSIMNRIYASTIGSITRATLMATMAQVGLNLAMLASPVGLVVIGIIALVAVFKYLWDNSKKFREILFGIWEAAKAVFHNIGVVIKRVWDSVVKPVIMAYYTVYKFVFTKIWEFIKMTFNAIVAVFVWWYDTVISIFTAVKDMIIAYFTWIGQTVSTAINVIGSFFSALWEWFSSVFSGFAKFIEEWLIQPLKSAFSGIWDWIVGLFDKIMTKLTGVFAPIKKFFKALFSSEGMTDVKVAYKEGQKKGAASYDKDHPQAKKGKSDKKETDPNAHKKIFDVAVGGTGSIGGVAAKKVKDKESHEKSGGSGSNRSLTVGKLIETMNVHYHGAAKESKESLKQSVTEAFLTAVSDFSSVQ